MSPNRRIILNIVATYGRRVDALVCGLFISRWVLAALGKTDFGLYGVVGGMMVIALLAFTMRLVRGRNATLSLSMGSPWEPYVGLFMDTCAFVISKQPQ